MWFLNTKKRNFSYFFRITTLYLGRPALPWFTLQLNGGWGASHFHSSLLLLVFAVNIFRRLEPWWMENRPLRSCCSVCVCVWQWRRPLFICAAFYYTKKTLFLNKSFLRSSLLWKRRKSVRAFRLDDFQPAPSFCWSTLPRNIYAEVPLLFSNKILDLLAISSLQLSFSF